jgi:hypothetical protein
MLIRTWLQDEMTTLFSGLTVNSKTIEIVDTLSDRNYNYLGIYLGDETNEMALNDVQSERGTPVNFELNFSVKANNSNYNAVTNEAVENIKKKILEYRATLSKVNTNSDFRAEIIDLIYTNIYPAVDFDNSNVLLFIEGQIIINQYLIEV